LVISRQGQLVGGDVDVDISGACQLADRAFDSGSAAGAMHSGDVESQSGHDDLRRVRVNQMELLGSENDRRRGS